MFSTDEECSIKKNKADAWVRVDTLRAESVFITILRCMLSVHSLVSSSNELACKHLYIS